MSEMATDARLLEGRLVAVTGRLELLTRRELAKVVEAHGGRLTPTLTKRTTLLIVGERSGPGADEELSDLQKARKQSEQNASLEVLTERQFIDYIQPAADGSPVRRYYSTAQLVRMLNVSAARIEAWKRAGLLRPIHVVDRINYFDFTQITGAKTLLALERAGIGSGQIRRSLQRLQGWMPTIDPKLVQQLLMERDGQLLIRLDDGDVAELTGQRTLSFPDDEPRSPATLRVESPKDASDWFEIGYDHEQAAEWNDAVTAYRRALTLAGSDPDISFNLANALYALDKKEQAAERLWHVTELDPRFAEAWNNLGVILEELGDDAGAIAAFESALAAEPAYADARYNLADSLDEAGRYAEAIEHWQHYLRLEPAGEWAEYARRRLAQGDFPDLSS